MTKHTTTDAFNSTLRLLARHVQGFWMPLLAVIGAALLAVGLATALFVIIAEAVQGGFTQALDEHVVRWLSEHRTPLLDEAMLEITTIGSGLPIILIVIIAAVFFWLSNHKWSVYLLLLGTTGGHLLNRLLKLHFERPRPSVVEWGDQVTTYSFPSGHATSSFLVYGILAYLVARAVPTRSLKLFTWIVAGLLVVAVGISRMYLGVHYPTDVVAGFILAAGWIFVVAAVMNAVRFFAVRRPETRREEEGLQQATSSPDSAPR